MTDPQAVHSTFRLERHYDAPPARVFQAFADPAAKRRWLIEGEGFEILEFRPAFAVGETEFSRFRFQQMPEMTNATTYQDIVPGQRIVFCYRMTIGGAIMSASLTTIELTPSGNGTLLTHTEQGTYLDGSDDGKGREEGTRGLLEILAREVGG
ncbi:SRPBCC family protein [Roseococcus sp. YIM B11640]|uniref:SRPBCC family protein n=1 Tax=Roseococcus sp. YIM B11640 TaxID=3133973 RepID=UPI003C7B08F7